MALLSYLSSLSIYRYKNFYSDISYIDVSSSDEAAYQQACIESIGQQPSSAYHGVVFVAPPPILSSPSSSSLSSSSPSSSSVLHVDLKELLNTITYKGRYTYYVDHEDEDTMILMTVMIVLMMIMIVYDSDEFMMITLCIVPCLIHSHNTHINYLVINFSIYFHFRLSYSWLY